MLLNTLPIMALAGTALAACPISVEVSSAEDHIAQVAVTNTGNETLTVFKGNTVFTDHATRDLLVSDESKLPPALDLHTASHFLIVNSCTARW